MPLNIKLTDYNNNNEHNYTPYIINDEGMLVIDKDWWNSLTSFCKNLIEKLVKEFVLDRVEIPHQYQKDQRLTFLYQSYLDSFDYQRWYSKDIINGPKNVQILKISNEIKEAICNVKHNDIRDRDLVSDHYTYCENTILKKFKDEISNNLISDIQYFVRLSGTSGKNEKPLRSFTNADDIIKHLAAVKLFHIQEYSRDKETCLILIPWNEKITSRCEFRIFVVNGKLTAASPQKWFELHQYTEEELETFQEAFENLLFMKSNPYTTFVADVYVDLETKSCHLIELNPFGCSSGAGSSFFNWIDDFNILHGLSPPEMRYLSIINF